MELSASIVNSFCDSGKCLIQSSKDLNWQYFVLTINPKLENWRQNSLANMILCKSKYQFNQKIEKDAVIQLSKLVYENIEKILLMNSNPSVCQGHFELLNEIDIIKFDVMSSNIQEIDKVKLESQVCQMFIENKDPINSGFEYTIRLQQEGVITLKAKELSRNFPQQGLQQVQHGFIVPKTQICFSSHQNQKFRLIGDSKQNITSERVLNSLCLPDSFEDLGVGGLDHILTEMLTYILLPRLLLPEERIKLQLPQIRGFILHGPPGTGKTLVARKISEILTATIRVVNGPELMSGNVGMSQNKVRNLFQQAKEDQQKYGYNSPLHLIVFDEIDSLCPVRGVNMNLDGGVTDQVVGQLLTEMDGFSQINNIIIIGTTNRLDKVDEALLRAGRLEIHYKINRPNLVQRKIIWKICTRELRAGQLMDPQIIEELAVYELSGAEIKSVVTRAILLARHSCKSNEEIGPKSVVDNLIAFKKLLVSEKFRIKLEHFKAAVNQFQI